MDGDDMPQKIDLTGERFGNLVVLHEGERSATGRIRWTCLCDCGKTKNISGYSLRIGETKTCGTCSKSTKIHKQQHCYEAVSIAEICQKACEQKMSFGQYVAFVQAAYL